MNCFGHKATFDGDWSEIELESTEETPEAQTVRDNCKRQQNQTGLTKERSYRNSKEVMKSRTRQALPSLKTCNKRIVQTETSKVSNFKVVSEQLGKIGKGKGKTKSEKK